MKTRKACRWIALALTVTMTADVIPAFAFPTEAVLNETQEELLWPEGEELPTGPPELESLQTGSGIASEDIIAEIPTEEEDVVEASESPILEEVDGKREENIKHFLTADHTYLAAVYPSAVHYEEDGVWKDIDNTLQLLESEEETYYENTASDTHIRFAAQADADTEALVSVERDGLTLSWGLASSDTSNEPVLPVEDEYEEGAEISAEIDAEIESVIDIATLDEAEVDAEPASASPSTFQVLHPQEADAVSAIHSPGEDDASNGLSSDIDAGALPEDEASIQAYNANYTQLPNLTSAGTYQEILPDIDLTYLISSHTVKEYITLHSVSAASQSLTFAIKHEGLTLTLTEDGRIEAYPLGKPEEVSFEFPVPYMYDSAGEESQQVAYSLQTGEGESLLTILPDQDWLKAENRVYPVVIDPGTETDRRTANIQDTFVQSKNPNQTGLAQNGSFYIGNSYPYNVSRAYVSPASQPVQGGYGLLCQDVCLAERVLQRRTGLLQYRSPYRYLLLGSQHHQLEQSALL